MNNRREHSMEGRIALFETDKEGKKPHFRGFITINDEEHEFAVWPSASGNGYSGKYKPKTARLARTPEPAKPAADESEIPF